MSRGGTPKSEGDQDVSKHPDAILFLYRTIGPLRVYVVDGTVVRNKIYLDFTEGGNSHAYPWMPPLTIWLDNANAAEFAFILLHELAEYNQMALGTGYEKAHSDYANVVEKQARDDPGRYDQLFDAEVKKAEGHSVLSGLAKVRKKSSY